MTGRMLPTATFVNALLHSIAVWKTQYVGGVAWTKTILVVPMPYVEKKECLASVKVKMSFVVTKIQIVNMWKSRNHDI